MSTHVRVWRVTATLISPTSVPLPPGGGLPERLEFQSRMPEQARVYGDVTVAIRKARDDAYQGLDRQNPQFEIVELLADVPGQPELADALARVGPILETVVDLLSFEMGAALAVGQVSVSDMTPPVAVGEDRAWSTFSSPLFDRYMRSVDMGVIQGAVSARLPDSAEIGDSKTVAVLRWFVKALETDRLHDQFIFLWIALEILCDASDVKVAEPYVANCGHVIAVCPEPGCGRATERLVRGATIRAFLATFGVDDQQARTLWQMRQLMHGAIPFDSQKLAALATLVQPLRAVVAAGLKARLGKAPGDLPIVAATGLSIHPAMGISGTHQVTDHDLGPLIAE